MTKTLAWSLYRLQQYECITGIALKGTTKLSDFCPDNLQILHTKSTSRIYTLSVWHTSYKLDRLLQAVKSKYFRNSILIWPSGYYTEGDFAIDLESSSALSMLNKATTQTEESENNPRTLIVPEMDSVSLTDSAL